MMKYVLGIDIGTSGTKAILYDEKGRGIDVADESYPLYGGGIGWAEQSPSDWRGAAFSTIKRLVSNNKAAQIVGIGLSGQMHGLVLLGSDDKPLANSIIWCDTRAQDECAEILTAMPNYSSFTLNPPIVGFTLPKLLWVKKHKPEVYAKINKILLPKDYVNFCLTGNFSTDVSDASGTGYFDVARRCWSSEVLAAFGIKEEWLPKVFESSASVGEVSEGVMAELGLTEKVAVAAGAGDQAAAGLGNYVVKSGDVSISLGSSGVVFSATEKPIRDRRGRVHTFCHAIPNMWHIMGVTQAAGISVKWFRDNIAKATSYKELDAEGEKTPIGSNGLLFLPYLNGERTPHLDSGIRGAYIGLSSATTNIEMYRATVEGVNFSLKNCMDLIKDTGLQPDKILVCGGGAKSMLWLQMLADILGENLVKRENAESGTKGAAILALVAASVYQNVSLAIDAFEKVAESVIMQNEKNTLKYAGFYKLYNELYPLLAKNNAELLKISR